MPNKFLIETALDIGIANLERTRKTDPKKLYEEVKSAISDESSVEMQSLYRRYMSLYEDGLKSSTQATATLKDELKWKHLWDLREAVKKGGKGLNLADIEWLNQFALAEYARQERDISRKDDNIIGTLKEWFHIYDTLKAQSIETSIQKTYKEALQTAFLGAEKVPFTFQYREWNNILELTVDIKENKILVGKREHALVGERIKIGNIGIDMDALYIPYTISGKDQSYSAKIWKKDFLKSYLDDILAGKDIRIQDQIVHIQATGELSPRTLGTINPEVQKEGISLDDAVKKWFGSLISGNKVEPFTVSREGKKYRFPVEIDGNSLTLWGRKFVFSYPSNIKDGSFEFTGDSVVFSGKKSGESRKTKLFEIRKEELLKQLSWSTDVIVFKHEGTEITAKGTGEYLPQSALIPNTPVSPVTWSGSETLKPSIELKWSIEAYAGWNQQELAKIGKTLKDLKIRLKELGFYKGEPDEIYDIATLNAVVAFQTAKRLNKIDGLSWITETIPALFGQEVLKQLKPKPWTKPTGWSGWAPAWWGNGGNPDKKPVPDTGWRQGWSPEWSEAPRLSEVEPKWTMKSLQSAMEKFRQTYAKVHKDTNAVLPDHQDHIDQRNKALQSTLVPLLAEFNAINLEKLEEWERKTYEVFKLEVAKYLSNELSWVRSRQYADYQWALDIAASIVIPLLEKAEPKINLPKPPWLNDIEKWLKSINPWLHARYESALKRWWTRGQFLSNPTIRAEWADVQSKIMWDYEDKLQKVLWSIDQKSPILKTPEQYEALKLMKTTIWSSNWYDFKKRNIDNWIQTGWAIGSAVAGWLGWVAIIGMTGWTWLWAVAWASVLGASIATLWWAISRGKYDEQWLVTEGWINLVTFGVAGTIGKIAKARYIDEWKKIAGYSLDASAGLALGVWGEYTRALADGASMSDLPHWKMIAMQLPWVLLPFSMGWLAHLKGRAQKVVQETHRAESQANIWARADADRTIQSVLPEARAIADEAKKQVAWNHATPGWAPAQAVAWAPKPPTTYVEWTHTLNNGDKVTIKDGRYSIADRDWNPKWWNTLGSLEETLQTNGADFRPGEGRVMNPTPAPALVPQATVDLGKWTIATDAQGIQYTRHTDGALYKKTPDAWAQWEKIDTLAVPWDIQSQLPAAALHPAPAQQGATGGVEHPSPITPRATVSPVQSPLSDISGFIKSSIPKNAKPDEAIKMGDITITPLKSGQYKVEYKGKTYTFDNLDSLGRWVNQLATTPLERAKLMASTNTKMMDNHLISLNGKVVPWTEPPIRIIREGEWTMVLEVQEGHGWWTKKTIDSLTEEEAISVLAQYTSKTPKQVRESIFRSNNTTLSNTVSHAEKEAFYKRWWKWAWESMEKWYKNWIDWTLNAWKTLANSPVAIFQLLTNWWHWTTWTKAFLTSWVMEWISMMLAQDSGISDWSFRDQEGNINWSNFGEAFAYAVIMANCGVTRWVIAAAWWTYYEFKNKSRLWAEVKP